MKELAEWPEADRGVDAETAVSRGKNTPLNGATLKGQVVSTIVAGEVVYQSSGLTRTNQT